MLRRRPFQAIVFALLLSLAVSCRCEPDQCPAFNVAATGFALPSVGDSLRFTNEDGERIVFSVREILASPAHASGTTPNLLGGCEPEPCGSNGRVLAATEQTRNSTGLFAMYFETEGGNNGTAFVTRQSSATVLDYSFPLPAPGDTTGYTRLELNRRLRGRDFDTLYVQERDILTTDGSAAVWRVFIKHPEGIIGFEDRQTASLFLRD